MNQKVRVRFAPSPTGYLHVGGARTALYNYLFAKKMNGEFILRIEDTDQARSTEESLKMVIEDLEWLGLKWNEGPDAKTRLDKGSYGPYRQSQRLSIYKEIADSIIKSGKAYYCFMKDEEIDAKREELKRQGLPPHVESPYENLALTDAEKRIKAGETAVVRFKTRSLKKDYKFQDIVRGEVTFPSDMVGDFVMLRSDGMPVYNFCCVVDDHLMKISHILRAEEHLPNTLRQLMIYEAMGWEPPQFGHLSLVLDEDRQKLSKRRGATSCHEFMLEGYAPEALKNFVLLLGWSHPEGKEILNFDDMISSFDITRFNSAGAVFDAVKLKWMNGQYLRGFSNKELWLRLEPFVKKAGLDFSGKTAEWTESAVQVLKTSFDTLVEGADAFKSFSDDLFTVWPESQEVLLWPTTKAVLSAWKRSLEAERSSLSTDDFLRLQKNIQESCKVKGKELFMALRVAVLGKPHGYELKLFVPLLTKESLLLRVNSVLEKLNQDER